MKAPSNAPAPAPASDAETVLVKPLAVPKQPEAALVSNWVDLLHHLGTRKYVADQLGWTTRTLDARMKNPELTTLKDMKKLSELAAVELHTLIRFAYQQMQDQRPVPKPKGPGRPPLQH